jgi:hypothetical protein
MYYLSPHSPWIQNPVRPTTVPFSLDRQLAMLGGTGPVVLKSLTKNSGLFGILANDRKGGLKPNFLKSLLFTSVIDQ